MEQITLSPEIKAILEPIRLQWRRDLNRRKKQREEKFRMAQMVPKDCVPPTIGLNDPSDTVYDASTADEIQLEQLETLVLQGRDLTKFEAINLQVLRKRLKQSTPAKKPTIIFQSPTIASNDFTIKETVNP